MQRVLITLIISVIPLGITYFIYNYIATASIFAEIIEKNKGIALSGPPVIYLITLSAVVSFFRSISTLRELQLERDQRDYLNIARGIANKTWLYHETIHERDDFNNTNTSERRGSVRVTFLSNGKLFFDGRGEDGVLIWNSIEVFVRDKRIYALYQVDETGRGGIDWQGFMQLGIDYRSGGSKMIGFTGSFDTLNKNRFGSIRSSGLTAGKLNSSNAPSSQIP
jgi:hypothetical protein